jgi:S-layer homology domain
MRHIRLASLVLAFAATRLIAVEPESASNAAREPVVLPSGAVVYPQGTDPDLLVSPKSGFGPDQHVVNIPFSQFFPAGTGDGTYATDLNEGTRWPTGGSNFLVATIDAGLVPNGADLQQVAFYFSDDTGGIDRNFRGLVGLYWVDSDGSNPGIDLPFEVLSLGAPGDTVLVADPNISVLYRRDYDNDGTAEVVSYTVIAQFGTDGEEVYDGSIKLRQVRLLFARQVSPAPAVASFGDVPTDHVFFQFIEALADSNITAGCGSGNFCPDAALTRGQMAVFLAKALGLHWPAF